MCVCVERERERQRERERERERERGEPRPTYSVMDSVRGKRVQARVQSSVYRQCTVREGGQRMDVGGWESAWMWGESACNRVLTSRKHEDCGFDEFPVFPSFGHLRFFFVSVVRWIYFFFEFRTFQIQSNRV